MYQDFARFYDGVEADAPHSFSRWILDRVTTHQAHVASVLELGCGTGAVLEALPPEWSRTGIDNSPAMLRQAVAKNVEATLVEADMTDVALDERFDLVICVFDTINHLLNPHDWRHTFRVARQHLHPGGLFLFDATMMGRLRQLAAQEAFVHDVDDDTIIMKVHEPRPGHFEWDIRVFEAVNDHYLLHREVIPETALPLSQIRELLRSEGFDVLENRDSDQNEASDDSRRTFFVCRAT